MKEEDEDGGGDEAMMVTETEGFWVEGNKRVRTKAWDSRTPTALTFAESSLCPRHYTSTFAGRSHLHIFGECSDLGKVAISSLLRSLPSDSSRAEIVSLVRWNRDDSLVTKTVELSSVLLLSSTLRSAEEWRASAEIPASWVDGRKVLRSLQRTCPDLASLSVLSLLDDTSPRFAEVERSLLEFENSVAVTQLKVGVLHCRDGQVNERDMYSNCDPSESFLHFLDFLGKPFTAEKEESKYNGGLHRGQRGMRGVWGDIEFIFHVSSLLPFDAEVGSQQIERKRHLGNDTIMIVFVEGSHEISPATFRSKVNQIFIFVRASPCGTYHIQIASKCEVEYFGPSVPVEEEFCFVLDENMRNFLFEKIVRGHKAAYHCPKYAHYWYARQEKLVTCLKDFF